MHNNSLVSWESQANLVLRKKCMFSIRNNSINSSSELGKNTNVSDCRMCSIVQISQAVIGPNRNMSAKVQFAHNYVRVNERNIVKTPQNKYSLLNCFH